MHRFESIQITIIVFIITIILPTCDIIENDPKACFSNSPSGNLKIGEEVIFNNCSENANEFRWDFGDGTFSTEEHPKHAYLKSGVYQVTLKIKNQTVADSCTNLIFVNVMKSFTESVLKVTGGNPTITYPHKVKFIYNQIGQISSIDISVLSGGPPANLIYLVKYESDGKIRSLILNGVIVHEYTWGSNNDVTISILNSTIPSKYVLVYNNDDNLKQFEKLTYELSEKSVFFWENDNIVKIEKYSFGKLSTIENYSYDTTANPLITIPKALVFVDLYLKPFTKYSANNVKTGNTVYYDNEGNEYLRYTHSWTYNYDTDNRLINFKFKLEIPYSGQLSNSYSETYVLYYD